MGTNECDMTTPLGDEEENISYLPLDMLPPPCEYSLMTQSFIADLERKVAFHKRQLAIWEAALAAALDERKVSERTAKTVVEKRNTPPSSPTEFILQMIQSTEGAKAGEIKDEAKRRQFPFANAENFPYKQLSRLKRLGRIVSTDGVYSAKPASRKE